MCRGKLHANTMRPLGKLPHSILYISRQWMQPLGETQQRIQHLMASGTGGRGSGVRVGFSKHPQGGKNHIISSGSSPYSHPWVYGRKERHVQKAQGRGISILAGNVKLFSKMIVSTYSLSVENWSFHCTISKIVFIFLQSDGCKVICGLNLLSLALFFPGY